MANDNVGIPGTGRSLGLPGKGFGGMKPGQYGEESMEERAIRKARMGALCRYCEVKFIRAKESQRFHDSRCSVLYKSGGISETTYQRWAVGLHEIHRWVEGDAPDRFPYQYYKRPGDYENFDQPRRRLYLTIVEIQMRAERSNDKEARKALRLLSDGILAIWDLRVDLFLDYSAQEYMPGLGEWEGTELEVRGMEALRIVADALTVRIKNMVSNPDYYPGDLDWLKL